MEGTHDNDNYPLLVRHPRLLAPFQHRDCNRERDSEKQREKDAEHDVSRKLSMIETRIKWLNWLEFVLMKKRTVANDSQVSPVERKGTG